MDEPTQTTFADMFKNSFLNMFPETVDPWQLVTVLAVSLLLGLCIYAVYRRCFMGVVYDHSFAISLVIMTVLVSVIIVTISSNVMLSLGMVGALSIVRFRTAIKEPTDLMFLFWSIATGIVLAAGLIPLAVFGDIFIGILLILFSRGGKMDTPYILVVHCTGEQEKQVRDCIASGVRRMSLKSKSVTGDRTELNYEVRLKEEETEFLNTLNKISGVSHVVLVSYNGDYMG